MFFISMFLLMLMYLFLVFSIAFLTFFERYMLGFSQNRLGPTKVSFMGIFQPIFDGLKLFSKDWFFPSLSYKNFFFFIPIITFLLLFLEWLTLTFPFFFNSLMFSILFFLCLVGFLVYMMLLSGIFSKSKYSFLGSLRSSSQSVSFEVIFFFFLFIYMLFLQSLHFFFLFNLLFFYCIYFYLFLILAELNRAPFDFSEGESELVSGFNLEFSSILFVLFFLSEYGFMIFFSILLANIFFFGSFFFIFFNMLLLLLIRSSYPRYRYDLMMGFFWFLLLPAGMFMFFLFFFILY